MQISVSIFRSNLQQTSCTCYDLHKTLSWAKWEEFVFHFFAGIFWAVSLQIISEIFGEKSTKKITDLDSL